MATDDVLVRFTSDINQIKADISKLEAQISGIQPAADKAGKAMSSSLNKAGDSINSSLKNIAAGVAAAFSVNAIIQFGKASVEAFAKAESQTNQLRFAVEKVGKLSTKVFDDLIRQAKELAAISFFDDEDIQTAQKLFIQIGLNANEVKKLTPLVLDLAAAQGTDLVSAAEKAVAAINGQTRGLKDVGANFENTGTKVGNYNELVKNLGKIQGAAAEALNTTEGALKRNAVEVENLQERVGQRLAPALLRLKGYLLEVAETLAKVFFPDSAKDNLDNLKSTLEDKFKTTSIEGLKQEVSGIDASIAKAEARIKEVDGKGYLFRTQKDKEDKKQAESDIAYQKNVRAAVQLILIDRYNDLKKAGENANSLAKQDAEQKIKDEQDAQQKANEKAIEEATKLRQKLQEIYTKPLTPINGLKTDSSQGGIRETLDGNPFVISPEEFERIKKVNEDQAQALIEQRKRHLQELISASADLVNSLFDLQSTLNDSRFSQEQERNDAIVEGYDREAQALEDKNNRGLISDKAYQAEREKLDAKRKKQEEEFAKIEKKNKHDQAVAAQNAAIFNIILNTAQGVSSALSTGNIPLSILIGILGTVQLVTARSQSIPKFKKGTKYLDDPYAPYGDDTILILADRGERIIPKEENRKKWDQYEAVETGNFHKYIQKYFIAPKLIEAKKQSDERRERSFATNVADSLIFNGLTFNEARKIAAKGSPVTNVDEVAGKIAEKIMDALPLKSYGSWKN